MQYIQCFGNTSTHCPEPQDDMTHGVSLDAQLVHRQVGPLADLRINSLCAVGIHKSCVFLARTWDLVENMEYIKLSWFNELIEDR